MTLLATAPATPGWRPLPDVPEYPTTCTCRPWNRYACGHCYHDQCEDCGFCTAGSCVCHCDYGLGFHPAEPPAEGPTFWLGGHHPAWLSSWGVPMCFSRNTLVGRASLPAAAETWMCDSGAFTEIARHGRYTFTARQYAAGIRRFRDEVGRLAWAGPMDYMCEPDMVAKTGLTVRRHIDLTVGTFIDLMAVDDRLNIYPSLQGWTVADYEHCADLYERRGVRLTDYPLVGVGSICRRKTVREPVAILSTLAARGLALHGYGLKGDALAACAEWLASADSMAWSADARWAADKTGPLPQCVGKHKSCANCVHWAMQWRERVIASLRAPRQTTLPIGGTS
ncbi:hypothetical protein AB0D90_14665 [Streptomyces althioticus]|uniref:deazapurine DNA modification protein DpdA family protein n=1 Tax=Streptomyces althioticus TaxID=83380 RepID=UPI0033D162D8